MNENPLTYQDLVILAERLERMMITTETRMYKFMFGMFVVFGFIQHFIK